MADNTIPRNAPGIAGFSTASYQDAEEPRYGEGVPTTTHRTIKSTAGITLALYSVISIAADGEIALATLAGGPPAVSNAYAILAAPVVLAAGQSMSLPFYREGHWDHAALAWDASFDTFDKRKTAFEGSKSPNIFISDKQFRASAIDIPN